MQRVTIAFNSGLVALVLLVPLAARAQQWPFGYGPSIGVEAARKVAAGAVAEARKNGWNVADAFTHTAGILVFSEKVDGTPVGSAPVAVEDAHSSAPVRRPAQSFQD